MNLRCNRHYICRRMFTAVATLARAASFSVLLSSESHDKRAAMSAASFLAGEKSTRYRRRLVEPAAPDCDNAADDVTLASPCIPRSLQVRPGAQGYFVLLGTLAVKFRHCQGLFDSIPLFVCEIDKGLFLWYSMDAYNV